MSRLTEKDKSGIVIMIKPREANNKLAELEDVLEEFGIESAEDLRELLNKQKRTIKTLNNYNKQGQTIMAENQQLKQTQNSKAIEILEKVLCQIKNELDTTKDKTFAQFDFMTFKPIIDFINNQTTKLKEINNETSK